MRCYHALLRRAVIFPSKAAKLVSSLSVGAGKGSFTLIQGYTRIGYSRGSPRVEESRPPLLEAKTEMSDGCGT